MVKQFYNIYKYFVSYHVDKTSKHIKAKYVYKNIKEYGMEENRHFGAAVVRRKTCLTSKRS